MERKSGIIKYYNDRSSPNVVIRDLDGEKTKGRWVGLDFVPDEPDLSCTVLPRNTSNNYLSNQD